MQCSRRAASLTGHLAANTFCRSLINERGVSMADAGLFIGWGAPVRGREAKGLEIFNEALAYYGRLQQDGVIEGFETAILEPHGGDLQGFILLRGGEEKLAQLRVDDEFVRMSTRAALIVE